MSPRQRLQLRAQELAGDVDRDVLRRPQRSEKPFSLGAVAGTKIDQRAVRTEPRGDLIDVPVED